ncbi:MAG: glycosyltransferase [Candidatus Moranbacteria bacterium]|jgi:GT2 family glycosyltransferase|nr:glycosyltransferase [Candidatus Moranbacteria bacterium]
MNWRYFKPKFEYEKDFDDISWPWVGHRYFAYDLIRNIKPKRIVELGTHRGTSLFSFCQAVKDGTLDTELCAVDTWQGDEHAGFYGDEIYSGVKNVIEKYYNSLNVKLIRKTFNEALSDFEDKSVDVLHIDGLHTYEAVKHDLETWFPKLKDDGIVLFHDIVVTRDDFGVFRFWQELKDNFETMEFRHSYGLGILFNSREDKIISLRNDLELYYSYLLEDIENKRIGELQQNFIVKNQEIERKNIEIENKNWEIEDKKQEIEEKNEEIEEKSKEIELIKSSSFWKMRNFYLKIKHYFIFIFLNPRKFFKKFLKLFPSLCIGVLNSIKKENPKKTAARIFNYIIYGKGVLNKDEIGKRRAGLVPSPRSMKEIESLEIKNIESIHFQKFEEVRVSIIIPVYNKWQYTYTCLSSLKKNVSRRISYEVVLVDDGSTDETQYLWENIVSNIVYVKNKKNLGFVGSCNVGAKKARGELIVFLNNDTFIKKNWLESLANTFKENENIGLVGSKLICADGVLQEAGGIVWNNKNCWNYGRFGNPTDPAFNYLKDIDYCSGASIMLSRKIFDRLGGFDEVYTPGYFEDTDLAFRVRQLGLRTVYQPKSELYHFENISAGKDDTQGMRQYIILNKKTFFDKWQEVINKENCDEGADGPFLARDRSKNKKTVLVIDHYVPTFDQDAGSRSTFQYIKLLCQMGYNVKFFGDNCEKTEPYTSILQQMGVEVLYGEWFLDNFNSWLDENGKNIDFVFVNRPHIFEKHIDSIKKYTNAKVVFYGHDLHFLRLKREYDVTKDEKFLEESNIWKKKELEIIKKSDVSLYPSVVEVNILNKIDVLKDSSIDVLNLNIYSNTSFDYSAEDRKDILFIGGFSHRPNVDAILWFCRDIFPGFIKKYPDAILYIVGSNPPKEVNYLSSKNIVVKGFVSDEALGVLYGKIRLVVVPLRYGAGIKGKIIESLYQCVPVLTTNCGAEGIDNDVLIIADDVKNFSQNLSNNYENYGFLNDLSKRGKDFIDKQYSINSAKEKIRRYFV